MDFPFPLLGSIALGLYGFSLLRERYYVWGSSLYYSRGWNKKFPAEILDLFFAILWVALLCLLGLQNGWYFFGILLPFFLLKRLRFVKPLWWPYFSILDILIPIALVFLGFGFLVRQLSMIPALNIEVPLIFFLADGRWFVVLAMIVIGAVITFLFPALGLVSFLGIGLALAGVMSFNGVTGLLIGEAIALQVCRRTNCNWMFAHLAIGAVLFIASDFYLILIDLISFPLVDGGKNLFSIGIRVFVGYLIFRILGAGLGGLILKYRKTRS